MLMVNNLTALVVIMVLVVKVSPLLRAFKANKQWFLALFAQGARVIFIDYFRTRMALCVDLGPCEMRRNRKHSISLLFRQQRFALKLNPLLVECNALDLGELFDFMREESKHIFILLQMREFHESCGRMRFFDRAVCRDRLHLKFVLQQIFQFVFEVLLEITAELH